MPESLEVEEEQQQQMTVDVDPEAAIQGEEAEEEDEEDEDDEAILARIEKCQRAREDKPLTEEEKQCITKFKSMLIRVYGTDHIDLEEMDERIERWSARLDDQTRLYIEELKKRKAEQKLDFKEIQRVEKILQEVDDRVCKVPLPDSTVTDVEFFLLDPWEDIDFMHRDAEERSLDLYYKRLFPNVPSAVNLFNPYLWNRLPEVDAEYLYLYSELCCLFKPDERCFLLHKNLNFKNSRELHAKAADIAEQRGIQKLTDYDIRECLQDVFEERYAIVEHKLKAEYDMFLLDCEYDLKLCGTFIPKEDIAGVEDAVCLELQQSKFNTWMEKRRSLNLGKEEHEEALRVLHEKNLREDCRIRIGYVRFKRAWAKEHGLISEEPCQ